MKTVRSAEMRKRGQDGKPLTPTEQRKKEKLMRQFLLDGPKGVSEEYRKGFDAIDWSKS